MFTLVLSDTYEFVNFVPLRKILHYIIKDKVEIISSWDEDLCLYNKGNDLYEYGKIKYPAILKLKKSIPRGYREQKFSKNRMYRRDHYLCQYCGDALTTKDVTVDHVLPKSRGGKDSWDNCVTACKSCNNFKGNKTPEEAGMKLKHQPSAPPKSYHSYDYYKMEPKHDSWKDYLGI